MEYNFGDLYCLFWFAYGKYLLILFWNLGILWNFPTNLRFSILIWEKIQDKINEIDWNDMKIFNKY